MPHQNNNNNNNNNNADDDIRGESGRDPAKDHTDESHTSNNTSRERKHALFSCVACDRDEAKKKHREAPPQSLLEQQQQGQRRQGAGGGSDGGVSATGAASSMEGAEREASATAASRRRRKAQIAQIAADRLATRLATRTTPLQFSTRANAAVVDLVAATEASIAEPTGTAAGVGSDVGTESLEATNDGNIVASAVLVQSDEKKEMENEAAAAEGSKANTGQSKSDGGNGPREKKTEHQKKKHRTTTTSKVSTTTLLFGRLSETDEQTKVLALASSSSKGFPLPRALQSLREMDDQRQKRQTQRQRQQLQTEQQTEKVTEEADKSTENSASVAVGGISDSGVDHQVGRSGDDAGTSKNGGCDKKTGINSNGGGEGSSSSSSSSIGADHTGRTTNQFAVWRGVTSAWTQDYENYLEQDSNHEEEEHDNAANDDDDDSASNESGDGDDRNSDGGVVRGGGGGSARGGLSRGPFWCDLCACPVPTQRSLEHHKKRCARKLLSMKVQCPTCQWQIPALDLEWHVAHACMGPPDQAMAGNQKYNAPYPAPFPHGLPPPFFLAALRRYGPGKGQIVSNFTSSPLEPQSAALHPYQQPRPLISLPAPPSPSTTPIPPPPPSPSLLASSVRGPAGRVPCAICGRRFAHARVKEHQDICASTKRGRAAPPSSVRQGAPIVPSRSSAGFGSGAFTVTKSNCALSSWNRLVALVLSNLPLQRLLGDIITLETAARRTLLEASANNLNAPPSPSSGQETKDTSKRPNTKETRIAATAAIGDALSLLKRCATIRRSALLCRLEERAAATRLMVVVRKPEEPQLSQQQSMLLPSSPLPPTPSDTPPWSSFRTVRCSLCQESVTLAFLANHQRHSCKAASVFDSKSQRNVLAAGGQGMAKRGYTERRAILKAGGVMEYAIKDGARWGEPGNEEDEVFPDNVVHEMGNQNQRGGVKSDSDSDDDHDENNKGAENNDTDGKTSSTKREQNIVLTEIAALSIPTPTISGTAGAEHVNAICETNDDDDEPLSHEEAAKVLEAASADKVCLAWERTMRTHVTQAKITSHCSATPTASAAVGRQHSLLTFPSKTAAMAAAAEEEVKVSVPTTSMTPPVHSDSSVVSAGDEAIVVAATAAIATAVTTGKDAMGAGGVSCVILGAFNSAMGRAPPVVLRTRPVVEFAKMPQDQNGVDVDAAGDGAGDDSCAGSGIAAVGIQGRDNSSRLQQQDQKPLRQEQQHEKLKEHTQPKQRRLKQELQQTQQQTQKRERQPLYQTQQQQQQHQTQPRRQREHQPHSELRRQNKKESREKEREEAMFRRAVLTSVVQHDPQGMRGIGGAWWRVVGAANDYHSLAQRLRITHLPPPPCKLHASPSSSSPSPLPSSSSLQSDPMSSSSSNNVHNGRLRVLVQGLGFSTADARTLLRVSCVVFSIEADVAVTSCRAGVIDVWKMSSQGPPRHTASWSTSSSRNKKSKAFNELTDQHPLVPPPHLRFLLQAALAVSAPALTNTANTTLPLPDGSNRSILSGGGSDGVSGDYGVEATGAATDHSSSESSCSGDGAPTLQRGGNGERSDGNNPEIAEYDTEMTIAAHLQRLLVSPTTTGPLSSPLSSTSSPLSPDPCGLDSYSLMRPANPALPIEGLVIDRMGTRALVCLGQAFPRHDPDQSARRLRESKYACGNVNGKSYGVGQSRAWRKAGTASHGVDSNNGSSNTKGSNTNTPQCGHGDHRSPTSRTTLLFIDLRNGRVLQVLRGIHATPITAMAVSAQADIVATVASGEHENIKLWPFPALQPLLK